MASELGLRNALEVNGLNLGDRVALVNDGELDGMNRPINPIPIKGHEDFMRQGVTVERDIEFFQTLTALPAALFGLIERMLSVVGTLGMASLTYPAGFSLGRLHRLSGTA